MPANDFEFFSSEKPEKHDSHAGGEEEPRCQGITFSAVSALKAREGDCLARGGECYGRSYSEIKEMWYVLLSNRGAMVGLFQE